MQKSMLSKANIGKTENITQGNQNWNLYSPNCRYTIDHRIIKFLGIIRFEKERAD